MTTDKKTRTVEDLREVLFDTIAELRKGEIDVERARAASDLAQAMINSARIEVEAARLLDTAPPTTFLGVEQEAKPPALPTGITGVTVHRLKG